MDLKFDLKVSQEGTYLPDFFQPVDHVALHITGNIFLNS